MTKFWVPEPSQEIVYVANGFTYVSVVKFFMYGSNIKVHSSMMKNCRKLLVVLLITGPQKLIDEELRNFLFQNFYWEFWITFLQSTFKVVYNIHDQCGRQIRWWHWTQVARHRQNLQKFSTYNGNLATITNIERRQIRLYQLSYNLCSPGQGLAANFCKKCGEKK